MAATNSDIAVIYANLGVGFPKCITLHSSTLSLIFSCCLATHNSLQMTLILANLKKLCIVSRHSYLAPYPFLQGNDELSSHRFAGSPHSATH